MVPEPAPMDPFREACLAVASGDLARLRRLLDREPGLVARDELLEFFAPDGRLLPAAKVGRIDREDYGMPARPIGDDDDEVLAEALGYAAGSGRTATVDLLLDRGVPIDAQPSIGTALHWAAYWGHLPMVEHLIGRGADPTLQDGEWAATPRGWARENGHDEVRAWLDEHGG